MFNDEPPKDPKQQLALLQAAIEDLNSAKRNTYQALGSSANYHYIYMDVESLIDILEEEIRELIKIHFS